MPIQPDFLREFDIPSTWLTYVTGLCNQHSWTHYYLWEAFQFLDLLRESGIESVENLKILEPGCGAGVVGALLALKGADVTYLDYSARELKRARHTATLLNVEQQTTFIHADLFNMPLQKRSFDIVWNDGVIEHFDTPDTVVSTMAHYCKQEGRVLVTTPAKRTPHTWFIRSWRRRRGAYERFDGWGKERSYDESDLHYFLKMAELINIKTDVCNLRRSLLDDYLILPMLEHSLSKETLLSLIRFVDRLETDSSFWRRFGFIAGAIGQVP
jgi:SAM-dependent methyltransferase